MGYIIGFELDEFLEENKIGLPAILECFKDDESLYTILDKATDIDEFAGEAVQHITDFVVDQYGLDAFVDDLSDEQKSELKKLL